MTYCVGILVKDGIVLIADTRTNAGFDDVSTYRKLHVFSRPGEKLIALATAGNLAVTQSVISMVSEGIKTEEGTIETLLDQPTMFKAAQFVGRAIRAVYDVDGQMLSQTGASFDVSMLMAGEIKGEAMRLFMIYRAGNFIEATADTCYLQIGEHKYGKPILDRAVKFDTEIYDALKLGLISMDSTMRSNLSVGLPIDMLVARRGACAPELATRIEAGEPYFHDLRERWSAALRAAHLAIPRPPYKQAAQK